MQFQQVVKYNEYFKEEKTTADVVVVKNKAQWNVLRGEVACKISESDFINLNSLSGLLVPPGVTAIVYIDGKEVVQINEGLYNFVEDKAIKEEMDRKVQFSGATGWVAKQWHSLVKLVTGAKVNDAEPINADKRSIDDIIGRLQDNSIISVYLRRTTNFPAFFGQVETPEERQVFVPMKIRTKVLDAEIGVHMFLTITDFHAFMRKYLLEKDIVTYEDIQDDLSVYVRTILQEELRNEEIDDYGISEEAKSRISARLKDIPQYTEGVGFVRIAEITCSNEEFDRFRKLTQELWCGEKELDFLHRSNEFKNRLARESNAGILDDKRNSNELNEALNNLNRDKLLSDDEFDAFKEALNIKKYKRSVESDVSVIEGAGDTMSAANALNTRLVLEQLDADESIYARTIQLEKRKMQDARDLNKTSLDINRDNDEYEEEKWQREFGHVKKNVDIALDIDERINAQEQSNKDKEIERIKALEEQRLKKEQAEYQHKENLANIRKDYTAEQLIAENVTNMDASAQAVFASSFVSKKEEEAAKTKQQLYEEAMARQEKERQDFLDLSKFAMKTISDVAGAQVSKAEEHKNEYREDARYQQTRIDHTQDKALEYTTRNNRPEKPVDNNMTECPVCGAKMSKDKKTCEDCGTKLQ